MRFICRLLHHYFNLHMYIKHLLKKYSKSVKCIELRFYDRFIGFFMLYSKALNINKLITEHF